MEGQLKKIAVAGIAFVCGLGLWAEVALPMGYLPLEYIESTGTQYINTRYNHQQNDKVVCDAVISTTGQKVWSCLFGAIWNNADNGLVIEVSNNGADKPYLRYKRGGQNSQLVVLSNSTTVRGRRITITCQGKTASWTDGTDGGTGTTSVLTGNSQIPMLIFNANLATTANGVKTSDNWWTSAKLYSFQIFDVNNVAKRDFVPCRTELGEVGLWDKVEGKFYGNSGTGVLRGSDGADDMSVGHVAYLESTGLAGKQYVNTLYNHKGGDKIECDVNISTGNQNTWSCLFGAMWNNNTDGYAIQISNNGATKQYLKYFRDNTSVVLGNSTALRGKRITITCEGKKATWNDGTTSGSGTLTSASHDSQIPMLIFNQNYATTAGAVKIHDNWWTAAKLYRFDIISSNGTPQRKLVPWRKADGTVLLYDHVTKQFYANAGSGAVFGYAAGPTCYYTVNDDCSVLELRKGTVDDVAILGLYSTIEKAGPFPVNAAAVTNFPALCLTQGRLSFADTAAKTITVTGTLTLKGGASVELDVTPEGADCLAAGAVVLDASATEANPMIIAVQATGVVGLTDDVPVITGGALVEADAAKFKVQDGFPATVAVVDGNLVLRPLEATAAEWSGAAGDGLWSTVGNWVGAALPMVGAPIAFPTTAGGTIVDDLPSVAAQSLTFPATAGAFTFTGVQTLTVQTTLTNASAAVQTFRLPMALGTAGLPFTICAEGDLALTNETKTALSDAFVKTGTGMLTINDDTFAAAATVRVEAGTLKFVNTCKTTTAGTAGEIHIANGARLDVNVDAGNGSNLARTEVTHGKTVYVEGAGPDGEGAVLNSKTNNAWGCTFGRLVLVGDAWMGGPACGNLSVRPLPNSRIPGSTLEGPGTLYVKGPGEGFGGIGQMALHTVVCAVGGIVAERGAYLQFEGPATGTVTNGVTLMDGSFLRLLSGPTFSTGIPFTVPAGATALVMTQSGNAVINGTLCVDGRLETTNAPATASIKLAGTLTGKGTLTGSSCIFSGASTCWKMKADDSGFTEKVDISVQTNANFLVDLRRIEVTYTGSTATPKVLVIGPAGNLTSILAAANITLAVVDGEGMTVPNCWIGINGVHELELHIADANVVLEAAWTGLGRAGDPTDPANWTCSNSEGVLTGGLPMIATHVTIAGSPLFTCTAETPLACASLTFDNVRLTADVDWSGLDLSRVTSGSFIDLQGHDLALSLAANSTYAATITDTSSVGQGGTLRLVVPEGVTALNSHVKITGSAGFAKDGAGIYIAGVANPRYWGETEIIAGTFRCTTNGLCFGGEGSRCTVHAGATLDFDGYGNQYYHPLVLDGGTLLSTTARGQHVYAWFSDVTLTADSFIRGSGFGFVGLNASAATLEMNGHRLQIDVDPSKYFYFGNLTVTGDGTILGNSGGWFILGGSESGDSRYVHAPTTRLEMRGAAIRDRSLSKGPVTFLDYVSDYTDGYDMNGQNGWIAVTGRFRPGVEWHNTQLAAGATIDLSNRTNAWNTLCFFEQSNATGHVAFASGTYKVDLGERQVKSGTPIILWEDEPPVNAAELSFKLLGGDRAELVRRPGGVYLLRGLMFIVR